MQIWSYKLQVGNIEKEGGGGAGAAGAAGGESRIFIR